MNILFISQLIPIDRGTNNISGVLLEFIEEWSLQGHYIQVIRPYYNYEKDQFPKQKRLKIGNNIIIDFIRPLRLPIIKRSYYGKNSLLHKLEFKPDVVVCELYNSYFTFSWLAIKFQVPLVIGLHMSDYRISKYKLYRLYQKRIFKNASIIACHSHSLFFRIQKKFPEFKDVIKVFPLGIPQSIIDERANVKNIRRNKIVEIVSVSKLIPLKHIDRVMKILKSLPSEIEWRYTLIGDGPMREELELLSDQLGIRQKIKFLGHISREQVIIELLGKEIFILPSYPETFGLAYLEAMSCGNIVIGSKGWGVDGIVVDGENGFLCDATSEQSIREKLLNVISLPRQEKDKIVNNGMKTVSSYSVKHKAYEYLKGIEKIVNV